MAHPSSAEPDTHEAALDEYLRLGGNCLHLHGEGGETHSRQAAGRWLRSKGLRPEFLLCAQICHSGWDDTTHRAIDRFTPGAVSEDVAAELDLLMTGYLDLVYLDDNPQAPLEPLLEALGREIKRGRVRALGVRNWTADRIDAADSCFSRQGLPGVAVIVTTELALAAATGPLWPEYVPFRGPLQQAVHSSRRAVFAHADDINLGQCLYDGGDAVMRWRRHWRERWDHPANPPLVQRVRSFAHARGLTPRAVNVAWLLSRPFPVVAIVGLPSLLTASRTDYEGASQLRLEEADLDLLSAGGLT
jgi:aryl-alcohol dehydrogenase-like predicted oxidoreductase